jgi:hypothetical protein
MGVEGGFMTDRELDHILAEQPDLYPSPNFTAAVMQAVRKDAATPAPIPFPWLIVIPGLLAWGLTLATVILIAFYDPAVPATSTGRLAFDLSGVWQELAAAAAWVTRPEVVWIAVALLLTLVCVQIPLRLMRGRS